MSDTITATRTPSAHADCTHPRSKAARAACRRARKSDWAAITRGHELAVKGATVRVHTEADMLEGVLLGWGAKLIVVRVDDERITVKTADALKIEARKADADLED